MPDLTTNLELKKPLLDEAYDISIPNANMDTLDAVIKALQDGKLDLSTYTAADVLAKLKTVDGAGSGLDADLLDGFQGSAYAKPEYGLWTPTLTDTDGHPVTLSGSGGIYTVIGNEVRVGGVLTIAAIPGTVNTALRAQIGGLPFVSDASAPVPGPYVDMGETMLFSATWPADARSVTIYAARGVNFLILRWMKSGPGSPEIPISAFMVGSQINFSVIYRRA